MRKLIKGIIAFRQTIHKNYKKLFKRLASGQSPDTLFIACSDSRVVPNLFASSNPGELFVFRNIGNLIPPCDKEGVTLSDESEAAAIEYAVLYLSVSSIIICGHSECGAMQALINDRSKIEAPNLNSWLRHGDVAFQKLKSSVALDSTLTEHNQLSQLNVLQQIEHVKTYPLVQKQIQAGKLRLHGWWFDIAKADVYHYEDNLKQFTLIDEKGAKKILQKNNL